MICLVLLIPGTFDIVLCVDNVETIGGASNSRKKELLPDLQSNGVYTGGFVCLALVQLKFPITLRIYVMTLCHPFCLFWKVKMIAVIGSNF